MPSKSRYVFRVLVALLAVGPSYVMAAVRGHVLDSVSLPTNNSQARDYGIDLNGDGNVDNQLGSVLGVLAGQGAESIRGIELATVTGEVVHLVELRSVDPTFTTDASAAASWYVGLPTHTPPVFDGTDAFRYDPSVAPAHFTGALVAGAFASTPPSASVSAVDLIVRLRIGEVVFDLPLQGARLRFAVLGEQLIQGRLNGSVRDTDAETILVPGMAAGFTSVVQSQPASQEAISLRQIFDANMDGVITTQEVWENSLIASLLAPDVDIRDADGNYAPNPANTSPDALSFGFAFTAVASSVALEAMFADGFEL